MNYSIESLVAEVSEMTEEHQQLKANRWSSNRAENEVYNKHVYRDYISWLRVAIILLNVAGSWSVG